MKNQMRRGSALIEGALFIPVLMLLLVGMVEFARIGYTYYTLHKIVYAVARQAGTAQGANFCNEESLAAIKNFVLTGQADGSADPVLPGLTSDLIQVRAEKIVAETGELIECSCDASGCDASAGGAGPDFIVVRIPDGYPVQLAIPFMPRMEPIPLRPQVRVPFGGL
jgi:hypothetical protein